MSRFVRKPVKSREPSPSRRRSSRLAPCDIVSPCADELLLPVSDVRQLNSKEAFPSCDSNADTEQRCDEAEQDSSQDTNSGKYHSPGLAQLRQRNASFGLSLEARKKLLVEKHHAAKSRVDSLCVGGGVTLWPDMSDMRLTSHEVVYLIIYAILMCTAAVWFFCYLHDADSESERMVEIGPLVAELEGMTDGRAEIRANFDVSLAEASLWYKACVIIYVACIAILIYFLVENVFARSRLTPRRIKHWVLLLLVTATWTLLCLCLLVLAAHLEVAVRDNVLYLNDQLGDIIESNVDNPAFHRVQSYWTAHSLLETSRPLLHIMGQLAVSDVTYYLQYYSLPVISALLLPVVKLIWSLAVIYRAH